MGTLGPLPCCDSGGQAGLVEGELGVHWAAVAVCQSPTTTPGRSAGTKGGGACCMKASLLISTDLSPLITALLPLPGCSDCFSWFFFAKAKETTLLI